MFLKAIADIPAAVRYHHLWTAMAWEDLRQRYRRTIFGFFWMTFAFMAFIVAKFFVFSTMNAVNGEYFLVWLVIGYWTWSFMAAVVTDGCVIFVNAKGWINGTALPLPIYAFQSIVRESISLGFTLVAAAAVVVWFGYPVGWTSLAALAAVPFFLFTALGVELLVGTLAAGARDLTQMIKTAMRVMYFITPILWVPAGRPQLQWIATVNPFTHYIALIRTPVMDDVVPWTSWTIAISVTSCIWILALLVFGRYHKRIVYWL